MYYKSKFLSSIWELKMAIGYHMTIRSHDYWITCMAIHTWLGVMYLKLNSLEFLIF